MAIPLHDNYLYAYQVDHDSQLIILHTMFMDSEPYEYTDVSFTDVGLHLFEEECMTLDQYSSNILFDIEEQDPVFVLKRYASLLHSKRNYGWPPCKYRSIKELARILTANGRRCFLIEASSGLCGFVFAGDMKVNSRESKWEIVT